jgi:uncharacterized protein YndB with AHSA1/START domain
MSSAVNPLSDAPVRKSILVKASAERAFEVFTAEFDSWWPRSHHIGKAPLKKAVIDGRVGGRCYNEQTDGTDCEWGEIIVWEPPRRFVMAWKINAQWQYEPDANKSSEVEVQFTSESDGTTRVDLEHRHFERMGADGAAMRNGVDSPGGWGSLLGLYATQLEKAK